MDVHLTLDQLPGHPAPIGGYGFRFGAANGLFYVYLPTSDANPAEAGPITYPEQAAWLRPHGWREEGWPGYFYADDGAQFLALIDLLLASGARFEPPSTAEELATWRARTSAS